MTPGITDEKMEHMRIGVRSPGRLLAAVGATVATLLGAAGVGFTLAVGWTFTQAVDAFVVSNLVIGLAFAFCGAFISWHRPAHPVGWMYLVGGNLQLLSTLVPLEMFLGDRGAPGWATALVGVVVDWAWPINIAILPLSLLLLPDGRLPSPRWRPVAWLIALTAPLFVLEIGTGSGSPLPGFPSPGWTLPTTGGWAVLWTGSEIRGVASILVGVAALVVRYRRGDGVVRRQLLLMLLAAGTIAVAITPWGLIAGTPIVVLFAIPLLPIAIAWAIVAHGLLDIRLVVARGLSYALLSGLVLAGYVVLVLVFSGVASALIIALLAFPLRARLQRAVQRLVYGDRDPLRVASLVGQRLVDLAGSLDEIRTAMRLPYVAVLVGDQVLAAAGEPTQAVQQRTLPGSGVLLIGLRRGESALAVPDQRVLDLLGGPLAVAVRATLVSAELQSSRERLVTAREEERLRLRRDLHDGLGPLLTGVALTADAAANLADRDPVQARELLAEVRAEVRVAIAEIRRVVDDLRPPALAELGLAGALRARAAQTARRVDGSALRVDVQADATTVLPAAVEVAAYRIATEALNNVVRHSRADAVQLRVWQDTALHVQIADDGSGSAQWHPGVGITAMQERAAELGGECIAGPSPTGGVVVARLPLTAA